MYTTPEQFLNTTKATLEAQFATLAQFNQKAFEGFEQVVSLNVNAIKASFEESAETARQLLAAKDAQEFWNLSAAQIKPNAEKALAYGRHLASITSASQAELGKAIEGQIAQANDKVIALIDELGKHAPAGSEQVIKGMKTAIGNLNASYDQFSKVGKQAVQTLEENLANATVQFTQAAEKATTTAKKK